MWKANVDMFSKHLFFVFYCGMNMKFCVMLLATSVLPLSGMRLDVRDFGAKGDGVADEAVINTTYKVSI